LAIDQKGKKSARWVGFFVKMIVANSQRPNATHAGQWSKPRAGLPFSFASFLDTTRA
jgi:hypothetical protein